MTFSTVLTPTAGLPGRPYGLFTGKGAAPAPPADGPHAGTFTSLTPTAGLPGRRYGSFAGKGGTPPPDSGAHSGIFTALTPTAGLPGKKYGSFAGKGAAAEPPPPTPTPTTQLGGGRGRKRRRAIVDGRLIEGTENIRLALTEWAERIDEAMALKVEPAAKPTTVKSGRRAVKVPDVRAITSSQVAEFAAALRAVETREADVKDLMRRYWAQLDDEDWIILQ